MIEYFKLLQPIADIDKSLDSIKDITIALANKAGYHRGPYLLKNGSVKERALYIDKFDDVLTAKWICYYKKLFISTLIKHPELSDFHVNIINDTFKSVMQSLNIDKIVNDDCINKYTNMALSCKIGIAIFDRGSVNRINDYNQGGRRKFRFKSVLNYNSCSYDALVESSHFDISCDDSDLGTASIVIDLKHQLSNNKYGLRLLEAMLTSRKKIMLSHIDDFVLIDEGDFNDVTKESLLSAYNTIQQSLRKYSINTSRPVKLRKSIKFSFNVYSYNTDVARVFGVCSAVFITFLAAEKAKQSVNKSEDLVITRAEIEAITALDFNKQVEIEQSLIDCGVLAIKPFRGNNTKNYYIIDFDRLQTIMTSQNSVFDMFDQIEFKKKARTPSKSGVTKLQKHKDSLKSKFNSYEPILQQHLCDWVDAVYDNPKGYITAPGLKIALSELDKYTNSTDEAVEILMIAIKGGLRDLTWAINRYEESKKQVDLNNFSNYNDIKSSGQDTVDEAF